MNTVTVTRRTTMNGTETEVFEYPCASLAEAKKLIGAQCAAASSEGYDMEPTSRVDWVAKLVVPALQYDETIAWTAEYDGRASAKWSPTMRQYKDAGRLNKTLEA